ncbi:MAG: hypothetical protein ACFFBI_11275 [Promethearchaeota archaeon]
MEVLEIKPIRNKEIIVYLVNLSKRKPNPNLNVNLTDFLNQHDFNFATIDLKNGKQKGFDKSPLAKILKQFNIPYYKVDIPEYAMGYLMAEIIEKEDQVNGLIEEFLSISDKESIKGVNLKSWIDYLKGEIQEKKLFLDIKLRPEWIVKKILDIIRTIDNNEIIFIHFTQNNVFSETLKLLKDLDIKVKIYEKQMEKFPLNLIINEEELDQWKC